MSHLNVSMLEYERDQLIHEATASFESDVNVKVLNNYIDNIRNRFSYLIKMLEYQNRFSNQDIHDLKEHGWKIENEYEASKDEFETSQYLYKAEGSFYYSNYNNLNDDLYEEGLKFENLDELWNYTNISSKETELENKLNDKFNMV